MEVRVFDDEGTRRAGAAQPHVKVVVLSDQLVVRAGLTMFICPEFDLDLVGEGSADPSSLPLVRTCSPDVVILDVEGRAGGHLVAAVKQAAPNARLLVLTGVANAESHQALLASGACSLLLKEAPMQAVLKSIRRLSRGEAAAAGPDHGAPWAIPGTASPIPSDLHGRRIAKLTDRERELIELIGEGLRNDQIAARIGVAAKTVRNQLTLIFDKLGVNDRLGLVVYAFEHRLLRPPPA